jgi:hypothetical protein
MTAHQHDSSVQYQAAAALRWVVEGSEVLQARAVQAGAVEALVLALVAFPAIAVVGASPDINRECTHPASTHE